MKINQEKFDELNQLDRIEFRQKEDRIEKEWGESTFFSFISSLMPVLGFLIIIALIGFLISKEVFISIMEAVITILKVFTVFLVLLFIADIFITIKKRKEIHKLEEEFFKVNPKGKK